MHIYYIGIKQCFYHVLYTKNSNNVQSVFGVRREDVLCCLKKSIVNTFSSISKEYVRSCYFPIHKIHLSETSKVGTRLKKIV
jgi:hypothetical protein